MNLITPDNGEKFVFELENATLTNLPGFLAELASTMVDFDPRFEILLGTLGKEEVLHANPYEAVPGKTIPE